MKHGFEEKLPAKTKRVKIAVIGHSGSGKSTLARFMGEVYDVPVLHLDRCHFLPGWVERETEDELSSVRSFLDENDERGWVVDGNYRKLEYDRRMDEADLIVYMDFDRFACFFRALRRSRKYKNRSRPSIAPGCEEKFDRQFRMWILRDGRTKEKLKRYDAVVEKYSGKSIVVKNQSALEKLKKALKTE